MQTKGSVMRKNINRAVSLLTVIAVSFALVACSNNQKQGQTGTTTSTPSGSKGPITVGSKIDTEGELLATLIELTLENNGFKIVDKSQTGPTDVVRKALLSGAIDIYPEYTGSGLLFFKGDPAATPATFRNPQKGYETDKKLDQKNNIVWLTPAKANNTWAIAVRKDFASANKLKTVSDFKNYLASGKTVKFAGSDEFFNNIDAWPAFAASYKMALRKDQQVVFSGGNTAQTEKAVAEKTNGVNFGMAYGTDGSLADLGLVVLTDDKQAQLVYWPVPTIRKDVLAKYPEIETLLAPVFQSLTLTKLQELNARIQVNGEKPQTVAMSYLKDNGLLK